MIPTKVKAILDGYGLVAQEFEPGSTATSEMAAEQIGVLVAQIAKSILFKTKDGSFFLVVCSGDSRVSNRKLKVLLGVKARMATLEETERVTGYRPGGVCPFGLTGIQVFVDTRLSTFDTIYPAAGTGSSGVPITYQLLCEISAAQPCDVCE